MLRANPASGQQPSPGTGTSITRCEQEAWQATPAIESVVQGFPSSQSAAVGHENLPDDKPGSQRSVDSAMPFPQTGWQSLSVVAFAATGQQVSPSVAVKIGVCAQRAEQVAAEISWSVVHGSPSSHDPAAGQAPGPVAMPVSQPSPGSTR